MYMLDIIPIRSRTVAIHWFEQYSYAVKASNGILFLVDPYFPRNRPSERYIHAKPPVAEEELAADFILLTVRVASPKNVTIDR